MLHVIGDTPVLGGAGQALICGTLGSLGSVIILLLSVPCLFIVNLERIL